MSNKLTNADAPIVSVDETPRVSVVIPTRHRPHLVLRAVRSALNQTVGDIEVLVVVDGPDPETLKRQDEVTDPRLRWIQLEQSLGGSGSRNAGVNAARGNWIAFLDDDDEWFPNKLEQQLLLASQSSYQHPIISSRVIALSESEQSVRPRKAPWYPVSEYLFCRSSPVEGEALLQTSSLMALRHLLTQVPFRDGLRKHQDWDWVLRAISVPGAGIDFVPEPLLIWHIDGNRPSVGKQISAELSWQWARETRDYFTPRAYASFLLTRVATQLIESGARKQLAPLLVDAFRFGRPRVADLVLFAGFVAVPRKTRDALKTKLYRIALLRKCGLLSLPKRVPHAD